MTDNTIDDDSTILYVNSDFEMEPGSVHSGYTWMGREQGQVATAIKIIKAATIEDYFAFIKERNLMHLVNPMVMGKYLYKVQLLD